METCISSPRHQWVKRTLGLLRRSGSPRTGPRGRCWRRWRGSPFPPARRSWSTSACSSTGGCRGRRPSSSAATCAGYDGQCLERISYRSELPGLAFSWPKNKFGLFFKQLVGLDIFYNLLSSWPYFRSIKVAMVKSKMLPFLKQRLAVVSYKHLATLIRIGIIIIIKIMMLKIIITMHSI